MRRLGMLYLVLGLVATQGCHKTLQHTGGVCDCYPPPVESLLVAPCPSDAASSYAPAPHVALPARNAALPGGPAKVLPGGTILDGTAPTAPVPPKVIEKQSTDGPVTEPIRSLPKIVDPK
jgi:hypothetical protein